MSQPEAGPSTTAAGADGQTQKARSQTTKTQQQDKAAENRARAQQNRERAAQNRAQKANNVRIVEGESQESTKPKLSPAMAGGAKQAKKPAKAPATANRQPKAPAPTQFKSKVVIRRLPPNLPEEVFWKAVSPWVRDAADCAPPSQAEGKEGEASTSTSSSPSPTVDFKKFVPGKLKPDANKQSKHARAYVRFLNASLLVAFHKAFDGHIFRDSKGKESVAIVEFAPYQKSFSLLHLLYLLRTAIDATSPIQNRERSRRIQTTCRSSNAWPKQRLARGGSEAIRRRPIGVVYDPKEKEREREKAALRGKSTPLLEHLRAVKMAKLESAAATKKAKKLEKKAAAAAAKGAGTGGASGKAGAAADVGAKGKGRKKEKGKSAEGASSEKSEEALKKEAAKKERRKQKRKAKAAAADGNPKEAGPAQQGPKQASMGQAARKKPEAKGQGTTADADGASKDKGKTKPPRRKNGPKEKAAPSTAGATNSAPQPAKIQILKRDS